MERINKFFKGFLLSEKCLKRFLFIYFIIVNVIAVTSLIYFFIDNINLYLYSSDNKMVHAWWETAPWWEIIIRLLNNFLYLLGRWFMNVAIIIIIHFLIKYFIKDSSVKD